MSIQIFIPQYGHLYFLFQRKKIIIWKHFHFILNNKTTCE